MLTEIEWWGGLLLIWLTFSYSLIYKDYAGRPKLESDLISTSVAFVSAVIAFSLFFYQLESPILIYLHVGSVVLGLIGTAVMWFGPDSETTKAMTAEAEQSEEEEISKGEAALGELVFIFPFLICLGLGAYKVREYLGIFASGG